MVSVYSYLRNYSLHVVHHEKLRLPVDMPCREDAVREGISRTIYAGPEAFTVLGLAIGKVGRCCRSVITLIRTADYTLRVHIPYLHDKIIFRKNKLIRADILSGVCKKPFSIYRVFCMPWTCCHYRHGAPPARPASRDLSASEKNSAQPSASSQP